MEKQGIITLAIESSCDETAVAVVENGRKVLSDVVASQIDIHKFFGGVVPEIASRHHLEAINDVAEQAMTEACVTWNDVDVIGVTCGPGLVGALLIGVATAKAYALVSGKPLIGVHHIEGHIFANLIAHDDLEPPFLALVISGGHTCLVDVTGYESFEVIGRSRDDAAGEAYDKVARVLGLGYPGGPLIDRLAKEGDREAVAFKRVYLEKGSRDFSFSGTKTGVINYLHQKKTKGEKVNTADLAASFQEAVLEVVVKKTVNATLDLNLGKVAIAGGVAANSRLRLMMQEACDREGIKLYLPPVGLCTDNGAMIGCAAHYRYVAGKTDDMYLDAWANMPLEREAQEAMRARRAK